MIPTQAPEPETAPQDVYTRGLEPDLILPDQFHRGTARSLSGEQRLMLAVLLDAMHIFTQPVEEWQHEKRRLFVETRRWFESRDRTWLFSFERVCEALDVDPERLRVVLRARRRAACAARSEPTIAIRAPIPEMSTRTASAAMHAGR